MHEAELSLTRSPAAQPNTQPHRPAQRTKPPPSLTHSLASTMMLPAIALVAARHLPACTTKAGAQTEARMSSPCQASSPIAQLAARRARAAGRARPGRSAAPR